MPTGQEGREPPCRAPPPQCMPLAACGGLSEPQRPEATGHVVPGMTVLPRSPERTQGRPHLLPGRGALRLDCTKGPGTMLG